MKVWLLLIGLGCVQCVYAQSEEPEIYPKIEQVLEREDEADPCKDSIHPESMLSREARARAGWHLLEYSLSECDSTSDPYQSKTHISAVIFKENIALVQSKIIKNCCTPTWAEIEWVDDETINLIYSELEDCPSCFCHCLFCTNWIIRFPKGQAPTNFQINGESMDY